MKVLWFHLMPYPDLPDDFNTEHRSVWVDIDPGLFDPEVGHRAYHEYLDELEHADRCGFDGICVNEHHANAYGLMPSPNLMASVLARSTDDAAIVVMGDSLALYNPPIRVAEEIAMLDCLSGGRVIAGFPVGTPMDICFAYGMNPLTLRERYHEAHDLIVRAWTSDEPFAFDGTYTRLRYVNPWPRPVQVPHPPIWIPGGGSVETWEWCAYMDYVYSYLSYFGYKAGKGTMDGFWRRMADLGHEPNPFQAGFIQFVGVADSEVEARRIYRAPAEYFFNRCLHLYPGFADPPGYRSEATVRAGVEGMIKQAADRAAARAGWKVPRRVPQHPDLRRDGREGLCGDRIAHLGGGAAHRGGDQPQRGESHVAAAVREHGQGPDHVQHRVVRRQGDARDPRAVRGPVGAPMVARPAPHS